MDDLTYTYDIDGHKGNKLLNISDDKASDKSGFLDVNGTGTEYFYDLNGNLTSDANKGITSISYNHLNLPTGITVSGSGHSGSLGYTYDATGIKLRKTLNESSTTTTDYAGNYIYENGILQFVFHPEGYALPDGQGGYDYVYQYKDHLGNVRLSYSDANKDGVITVTPNPATTEVIEENHYYPFGLEHKGYNNVVSPNANSAAQKYRYNGKEIQEELGLDWYDYGDRNYDSSIGRFMNMDLYAHNYMKYSPYGYVLNNPISNVDYKGKFVLPKEFVEKYGRLANYLKNDIQGLLNNKRIVNGLKKFGGFTDAQLKEAFTYGQGPTINIDQLDNIQGDSGLEAFGLYTGGSSFVIDVDLVEDLENATGTERDYLLFLTAVTIMHEFVHLGYDNNGLFDPDNFDPTYEEGNEFEIAVYGKVFNRKEAEDFIEKYLEEQKKNEEESQKKEESFNNLIKKLSSLESGTYKWNGEEFVKTD